MRSFVKTLLWCTPFAIPITISIFAKATRKIFYGSDRENQIFPLQSGRKVGFATYGKKGGIPVIYIHGFPGSRFEGAAWDDHAKKEGVELFCLERPGIGLSEWHHRRRLIDHPEDIQKLAQYHGLDNYYILGMSGGGPYALACAKALPSSELKGIAIVNGNGPKKDAIGHMIDDFDLFYKLSHLWILSDAFVWYKVSRHAYPYWPLPFDPYSLQKAFDKLSKPKNRPPDCRREVEVRKLQYWANIMLESKRGAFQQGTRGYIKEAQLYTEPWEFELGEISFPNIHFWHAKDDRLVPFEFGKKIAKMVPNSKFTEVSVGGHTSIVYDYGDIILQALVADAKKNREEHAPWRTPFLDTIWESISSSFQLSPSEK